jgi:hypothetical protein
MPSDIKRRLEAAIREADEKSRARFREARVVSPEIAQAFAPVEKAAREIEDYLRSVPGVDITINPDSVSLKLGDLELWLSYDPSSKKYVGEESGHSWYDSERYSDHYTWSTAEECTDALIRSSAEYVRMARAINQSAEQI